MTVIGAKLRITPGIVLMGLAIHMALRLGAMLAAGFGQAEQQEALLDITRIVGSLCAYALAFIVCWQVADEYRETRWMRLAWLALTMNAGMSLLRPFSRPLPFSGQADLYYNPPEYALLLHCVLVPANFFLLAGLLAIWWAYRETGLGFKLKRRDGLAILGLMVVMLLFFIFRNLLTEAQAVYRLTSVLQLIAQIQMFLIALASLLLHRVSVQMGSGRLAIVLRWMAIYALFRLGMVLLVSLARYSFPQQIRLITDAAEFGWQAAPWLFALAVAYHAELTALAAERLARMRNKRPALVSLP